MEYFVLDTNGEVIVTADHGYTPSDPVEPYGYPFTVYPKNVSEQTRSSSEYWIWNPEEDAVYGPYVPEDAPSFLLETDRFDNQAAGMGTVMDPRNSNAGNLFRVSDGSAHALHSALTHQSLEGFEQVDNIEIGVSGGRRNGRYEVYDSSLNLLCATGYDKAAAPIHGRIPIQTGNSWILVSLSDAQSEQPAALQAAPAVDAKDPGEAAEREEYTGIYRTESRMKVRSAPGYAANEQYVIEEGTCIHVDDLTRGDRRSLWGKLGENRWICLYDDDYLYCRWNSASTHCEDGIINDVVREHYRALDRPKAGMRLEDADWQEEEGIAKGAMKYEGGTLTVTIDLKSGQVKDDQGWDTWSLN